VTTPLRPWREHLPAGADPTSVDLGAGGTLVSAWTARWEADPASLVLGAPDDDGGSGQLRWLTAGGLEEASRRAAHRLLGTGAVPGDRVLWSVGSSLGGVVAHLGALRAGLVVVPVNPAYGAREVGHIVADVRPRVAVVDDPVRGRWASDALGGDLVVTGPDLALPEGDGDTPLDAADPDDPALVCFTSGTTGRPKGAVLRHRNLLASARSVVLAWGWTAEDRLVHALPVFHAHGLCVGVYGTLVAGASVVLLPSFDPGAVADQAAAPPASLFFGVPTMYHRLLGSGHLAALSRLRLCVSGSAPLAADLHRRCSDVLAAPVLERYGMTETLMNVSNPLAGARRAGTVGFPLPGIEVCLGSGGEVGVRGPNVFDHYWERPVATAEAFVPDTDGGGPWFVTGDLGAVDDDGYLVLRGRSSELVITGGFNVYPAEVEDVLRTHPSVADVAVVGTPSEEWGEVVTAFVVADGHPPTVEDLATVCAGVLADYKRPRLVHAVDHLPRNALGKVVRAELRAAAGRTG
jgi:malonyl-CoA/methylmalonyl-CoA synthetase